MELSELRQLVGSILTAEETEPTDWKFVEQKTDELYSRLAAEPDTVVPELVYHYLSDADIRERDAAYAQQQRDEVRHFVDSGEYIDSTPVPGWACLLTVVAMLTLGAWALF